MRTLTVVCALMSVLAGQSSAASIAGTWTARFEGTTFLRLELKAVNGTIAGGMSIGHLEVDKNGDLRQVGDSPRDLEPIFDVTQRPTTVTFSFEDGNDPDRFEFRLLDGGLAELQILLNDEDREEAAELGVAPPKPIRLTKQ